MNRHERRKKAIEKEQRELVDQYKAIWKKADEEDREPTEDERLEVEAKMKAIEDLNGEKAEVEATLKTLDRVDQVSKELGPASEGGVEVKSFSDVQVRTPETKSLGELFVESKGYKDFASSGSSGGQFNIPSVELKGTLTEAAGSGGAVAAPVPQVIPGVVDKLFQRNTIANLIGSGQASTNSIRYVVEGTATSGAAGVAEGGKKPESTLALSTVDESVKKIATVLPVSEETLEDAAQVRSYINGRLVLFVQNEEDRQLIRGSETNEVKGIIGRTGVNIYAGGTAAGNKAIQLFKALNGTRGSAFVEPDFVVMNPSDWQDIRLLTDKNEQLYGGGPFYGPYGGPQGPAGASGQVAGGTDMVWGKPVYLTATIGAGTALVGSSSAAQVFRRGGISVDASNSHAEYFRENLVALRAEERLALAVYRPSAFTEVRLA